MSKRRVGLGLLFLICCLALQGCVKANFTDPVTQFQASINKSAAAITTYYTELNDNERTWYLQSCLHDQTKEVGGTIIVEGKKQPSPLYYKVFSPEGIKARTDSIVLIGQYANRLAALAGSDAPANVGTAVGKLSDNLKNLSGTFNTLQKKEDPTASSYITPIGAIVALWSQEVLEAQREKLLEQAINEGGPAVNDILDLLQQDLAKLIQPVRVTGFKQALAVKVNAYNDKVNDYKASGKLWPLEDRRKMLAEIEKAAKEYELAVTTDPASLIQSMRQANNALVDYARSDKAPKNLTELVAALGTFQSEVQIVVVAMDELRMAGGN
ncbi:MAG: hypothetical protein KQH53_10540 [Desulfarculaceae bacterium]|nr:hypothetical protein [Desulfarculaceae bacterium]